MTIRIYLVSLKICLILSIIALIGILIIVNPYESGFLLKILFFIVLFFALVSLLSLLGFYLKKDKIKFKKAVKSFWQAIILSSILIILIILWQLIKNLI